MVLWSLKVLKIDPKAKDKQTKCFDLRKGQYTFHSFIGIGLIPWIRADAKKFAHFSVSY